MKNNKLVATGLSFSVSLSLFTALFETSLGVDMAFSLYALAGIGMIIFGFWASNLLFKIK